MILLGFPRGQTVFFVISGFLITHQIVSQPLLGEGNGVELLLHGENEAKPRADL
jgi:peptidoglycan/LPS O-acetylase OafA/YrhL